MDITINGKTETFQDDIRVSDLLASRKIRTEMVAVELNDTVLARDRYPETRLKEGDKVEFLYYMGGGIKGLSLEGA